MPVTSVEREAHALASNHEVFMIEFPGKPISDSSLPLSPARDLHRSEAQPNGPPILPAISAADVVNAIPSQSLFPAPTYIEKEPQFPYKSDSDDIMSMDIIFDNVPIEEDPSVGAITPAIDVRNLTPIADVGSDFSGENVYVLDASQTTPIPCGEFVMSPNDIMIIPPQVETILPDDEATEIGQSRWPTTSETVEIPILQLSAGQPPVEPQNKASSEATPEETNTETASKEVPACELQIVKDEAEPSVSVAPTQPAPMKRKKKPLPVLVGRNKKVKTEPIRVPVILASEIETPFERCPPEYSEVKTEESQTLLDAVKSEETMPLIPTNPLSEAEASEVSKQEENALQETPDESPDDSFLYSLVVVESQDANDKDKTVWKVYFVCPETKKMSDEPLDLSDEVIQKIRQIRASKNPQ